MKPHQHPRPTAPTQKKKIIEWYQGIQQLDPKPSMGELSLEEQSVVRVAERLLGHPKLLAGIDDYPRSRSPQQVALDRIMDEQSKPG